MSEAEQTRVLRRHIEQVIDRLPMPLKVFGLADVLGHLQAWVSQVDARLELLEQAAAPRDQKLIAAALSVVGHAQREGQLHGAISDEARPGGPRQGDWQL